MGRVRRPQHEGSPLPTTNDHLTRPIATLTSSLDIPVEGVLPISKPTFASSIVSEESNSVPPNEEPEGRRAPRKSKIDALAALQTRSVSPFPGSGREMSVSMGIEDTRPSVFDDIPTAPIPAPRVLDLQSVKTKRRRNLETPKPRPFGLEDCPTYYPTSEEFSDPLNYIRSISDRAQEYGICKVVPPEDWNMPFVTDTETFRFKTRVQRLNSIEAASRAKLNFLEQLYRFHKQQGNSRVSVPTVNHKPLDLWLLRKEVQNAGGYETVTKSKRWGELGRALGYTGIPGLSAQLRNAYTRIILPYENFYNHVRNSPSLSPGTPRNNQAHNIPSASRMGRLNASVTAETNEAGSSHLSSPLSEVPDDNENNLHGPESNDDNKAEPSSLLMPAEILATEDIKVHVPIGEDFGFDEGEEHTLASFQARDMEFRRRWFESHPPQSMESAMDVDDPFINHIGKVRVSEYDVEHEFWRLVQSPYETVEIEYGADVHSTTHGSAMPTLENHPLDPYSRDGWNLNNIPIFSDSLLRYIKSDISGMTVPWTYVGMVFATFCWHNEDHYTSSINYMHWGETKTWYGIPGDDAEKFEAAIKKEAPDLFEAQPDLLFQLVTLMNPARVREAGVRVYACNQRAGEFVITFPKAYHAGFNHGLNFNEAVNFALPEWLPYGCSCVQRYQEHRKLPVFSHDELLITITQQSATIKTAMWLHPNLQEMYDREIQRRQRVRTKASNLEEVLVDHDHPEEQYQCAICKVVCLDHMENLCNDPLTSRVLRKRFSDEHLADVLQKVAERAAVPIAWRNKLKKLLEESPRPPLRSLRALLAEGERINYNLVELPPLRKCVLKGNEWVDSANVFLARKPNRKRVRKPRSVSGPNDSKVDFEDLIDRPEKSLQDLYSVVEEVTNLGFDAPEITALRSLGLQAEEIKKKARNLLEQSPGKEGNAEFLHECETLLAQNSLNIYLEELVDVERISMRAKTLKELEDVDENTVFEDIRNLVGRAKACGVPPENHILTSMEEKLRTGEDWMQSALSVMSKSIKTLEELDQITDVDSNIPVDAATLNQLSVALSKASELDRQAKAWLDPNSNLPKPKPTDVLRVVNRADREFSIPSIDELKSTVQMAYEMESRCYLVLTNNYQHEGSESIFETMRKWQCYAREKLAIYSLPNTEKMGVQLDLHEQWLKRLPWYCAVHKGAHGQQVMDDVLECTKPEDDTPPSDGYFTCICTIPVRPPPPGQASDAVQCDHCFARFHGACAANGGSCPFCDHHHWNGSIHKERASYHYCFLPTILLGAPDITKHYSLAWRHLDVIVTRVDRLSTQIGNFLAFASQPGNQRPEYIPQVRHYMRKLFKIQFAVSPNPEVSYGLDLAGLHRILASQPAPVKIRKRRRPKFLLGPDIDSDASDGCRCVCRGSHRSSLTVRCELCKHLYHSSCTWVPSDRLREIEKEYTCPLCCIRKARSYPYADVRVRFQDEVDSSLYVDFKACLNSFAKEPIKHRLPPSYPTIVVELIRFNPGQPETIASTSPILPNTTLPVPNSQVLPLAPSGIVSKSPHSTHDDISGNEAPPSKRRKYSDNALGINPSERYSWTPDTIMTQHRQLSGSVLHNGRQSPGLSRELSGTADPGNPEDTNFNRKEPSITSPGTPQAIRKVKLLVRPQEKPVNGSIVSE
ncbi:hypothetical protein Clacol_001499 [Clathrus columnatus]|uniref:[histone H3]-trimethyl-L-lysine(4) demethylase n=1 Tax=Clathrus columnatus TaxID=1419009 RepID=A0AAV5A3H7_9AGAM|nr:hypothetical protein Clacol_001499 [Clathrus columnatus]